MIISLHDKVARDFVKLQRHARDAQNGIFEIDVYNLCKLVDALSNGNLLSYLDCFVVENIQCNKKGVGIGATLSIDKISKYLSNRLKPSDAQFIFGRVNLVSSKDYDYFFMRSRGYDKENISKEIRRYLNDNFEIINGKLVRIPFKRFINV